MAEKLVTEEDVETGGIRGPLSSGSLHSMGTHDSSSSLDWAMDGTTSKVVSCSLSLVQRDLTLLVSPLCNLISTHTQWSSYMRSYRHQWCLHFNAWSFHCRSGPSVNMGMALFA